MSLWAAYVFGENADSPARVCGQGCRTVRLPGQFWLESSPSAREMVKYMSVWSVRPTTLAALGP